MNTSLEKRPAVLIKEKAYALGFDLCGIASSDILTVHESALDNWCTAGMNGDMTYLARDINKRVNPGLVFPGAKSVIVTGLNYYTERKQGGKGIPVISRYAYGFNYHDVILAKLNSVIDFIHTISPGARGKAYVDSAPILEKAWAQKAGLGWPGRHSVVINRKIGSFFFLGIIILNIELVYDDPVTEDYCGTCKLCIDSCPTSAINENRTIDARRCIAYLTIESDAPAGREIVPKLGGRVFGCDRCQEVCPWNKHASPNNNPEFEPSPSLLKMTADDWRNLTKDQFKILFKKSAIGRTKYRVFMEKVKDALE